MIGGEGARLEIWNQLVASTIACTSMVPLQSGHGIHDILFDYCEDRDLNSCKELGTY